MNADVVVAYVISGLGALAYVASVWTYYRAARLRAGTETFEVRYRSALQVIRWAVERANLCIRDRRPEAGEAIAYADGMRHAAAQLGVEQKHMPEVVTVDRGWIG